MREQHKNFAPYIRFNIKQSICISIKKKNAKILQKNHLCVNNISNMTPKIHYENKRKGYKYHIYLKKASTYTLYSWNNIRKENI